METSQEPCLLRVKSTDSTVLPCVYWMRERHITVL
uniref:Uncharacterized protein n=1 Tax=Anguilla anguilla TaxID=7936 RepID=A0A0E9UHR7_ANGAN